VDDICQLPAQHLRPLPEDAEQEEEQQLQQQALDDDKSPAQEAHERFMELRQNARIILVGASSAVQRQVLEEITRAISQGTFCSPGTFSDDAMVIEQPRMTCVDVEGTVIDLNSTHEAGLQQQQEESDDEQEEE